MVTKFPLKSHVCECFSLCCVAMPTFVMQTSDYDVTKWWIESQQTLSTATVIDTENSDGTMATFMPVADDVGVSIRNARILSASY